MPETAGVDFVRRLLGAVYGVEAGDADNLHALGFRVLPTDGGGGATPPLRAWPAEDDLPAWTLRYRCNQRRPAQGVKYLLTFRPFGRLPEAIQTAYLEGRLHLIPYPGSLIFWGAPGPLKMRDEAPLAVQTPLLTVVSRHEAPQGLRVPQAGWMHEPKPGKAEPDHQYGPLRNTFRRTHRWAKVLRDQDELALMGREDKLLHVLFSTIPDDLGLYDKPMARNVQMWTHDFRFLLNGPRASGVDMMATLHTVEEGGVFGYRFVYPAMRVGRHEVYWHRPLVAWMDESGRPAVLPDAPLGYLTAYRADDVRLDEAVELWPRLLRRDLPSAAVEMLQSGARAVDRPQRPQAVRRLGSGRREGAVVVVRPVAARGAQAPDASNVAGRAARGDRRRRGRRTAGRGREGASRTGRDGYRGRSLRERRRLAERVAHYRRTPDSLTFDRTATRPFETTYWKTIAFLAEGRYRNKNNADCVRDKATERLLSHERRDLEALGDYLLDYYTKTIAKVEMTGKALTGEMPFHWRTDFAFPWADGWAANQDGRAYERNLITVIPGRDRKRAVILADHYDTAYMADCYDGDGARVAAAGADDNHSATACLMLAAPILLDLSRQGRLGCDVWLVHLTGEEFPSDCLGARALTQRLVEGTLKLRLPNGRERDLSRVEVRGVYVMDMIAHNNDRDRDVFQMSPGTGAPSLWLARQAQIAAETWNASVPAWNQRPLRRGRGRGKRSMTSGDVPEVAAHPTLLGEVRTPADPHSTLYNTDGQVFSDAGVPVVLFMENYDINRQGYHDTHDTMANIDLDYGSAVAAIAIESAARAATEKPPRW